MLRNSSPLRLAPLALLSAGVLPAQSPEDQNDLSIPRTAIHTATPDPDGGDYGTWAAGTNYKVEFRSRAVRFVPYLGPDYPKTQSWTWQTRSVEHGHHRLVSLSAPPEHSHTAFRYELQWPGIVERYDVLEAGLEQSFVLAARPAGTGSLTICGTVDSELSAPKQPRGHQTVPFRDSEGSELIQYGRAFAIDADGRRTPLDTSHERGVLRIHVDEQLLKDAQYPLIIDPLVSTTALDSSVALQAGTGGPDIAIDRTSQQQMVAFLRAASSTDLDMTAVIYPYYFNGPGTTVFSDLTSAWSVRGAALACASSPRKYVLGFVREFGTQVSGVRVHVRDSGNLVPNSSYWVVPRPTSTYDARVDVGGTTRAASGTHAMLVFERRVQNQGAIEGVMAMPVDISGSSPVIGTAFAIESAGRSSGAPGFSLYETSWPAITKQARAGGSPETWMVAFQERQLTGTTGVLDVPYIVARLVSADGTHSTGHWSPTASFPLTDQRLTPKVAGLCSSQPWSSFAVAFSQRPAGSSSGTFVAVEQLTWIEGDNWPTTTYPQVNLPWSGGFVQPRVGGIAHDKRTRSHWMLTTNSGIHRIGFGGRVEEIPFSIVFPDLFVPGGIDYYDSGEYAAVVGKTSLLGATGPATGYILQNPRPATRFTTGPACGTASIDWTTQLGARGPAWDQQIGHRYTQIAVSGTATGTLHFLLLGTGVQNVGLAGVAGIANGCRLLVPSSGSGFIEAIPLVQSGPDARWNLPLPASLSNFTLHCQGWHLPTGGAEFVNTERLSVELLK